jgi:hypothetical protein
MATTTKRWIDTRPERGVRCRRRNPEGQFCNRELEEDVRGRWEWDRVCVAEHRAAKAAERKASTPATKRAPKRAAKADSVTKGGAGRCAAGRQRSDGTFAYGIEQKTRCGEPTRRPNSGLCEKHDAQYRAAELAATKAAHDSQPKGEAVERREAARCGGR